MIQIFRNARRHLLRENRLTRYLVYAAGEIILVVMGILIAIQINDWNLNRQRLAEEQELLHVLRGEFESNLAELEKNKDESAMLVSYCDSLLYVAIPHGTDFTPEKTTEYVRHMGGYSTFDPANGVLSDLIGSGRLNLIRNDTLRHQLSSWSVLVEDTKEDETRLINFGDNYLVPLRNKHVSLLARSNFTRDVNAILRIPEFENMVASMRHLAAYNIVNYEGLEAEINSIIENINKSSSSPLN